MTKQTFYRNLSKATAKFGWKWEIQSKTKAVRYTENGYRDFCPINAVALYKFGQTYGTLGVWIDAKSLDMSTELTAEIIASNDNSTVKETIDFNIIWNTFPNAITRKTILRRCGLSS